jgi:hypothetical protein
MPLLKVADRRWYPTTEKFVVIYEIQLVPGLGGKAQLIAINTKAMVKTRAGVVTKFLLIKYLDDHS